MFELKSQQYHLAPGDSDSSCDGFALHDTGPQNTWFRRYQSTFVVSILLFSSLIWNGLQFSRNHELETKPDYCRSPYSTPICTPILTFAK